MSLRRVLFQPDYFMSAQFAGLAVALRGGAYNAYKRAGIEVQVLDLGYAELYEKRHKKPSDWFTSHGDVFPTQNAKMKPFPPVAPNGKRSFPSKNTTKGINQWNHYYIRAINGEVRLWVNGVEVSGGTDCQPAIGYLLSLIHI